MPRPSHTIIDSSEAIEISEDEAISIDDSDAVEEFQPSMGSQGLDDSSNDIKKNFELVLQDSFEFKGTFAYTHSYSTGDVPNPCLSVTGLGPIGLPLNDREARTIISSCEQGGISAEHRDGIWEILTEQIQIKNLAWDTWLNSTLIPAICKALDTNGGVPPYLVLDNLSVRGVSSQVMKPKNINDQETKFGTLLITLPSEFIGGELLISHAGQTRKVDFAPNSSFATHVVASYVGVEQLLQPVATGYHLTLSYSLLQPLTHIKSLPALPDQPRAARRLREILLSWTQNDDKSTPRLVTCLLRNKYARTTNFSAQKLVRSDANLFTHLRRIAVELDLRLYLAHIDLKLSSSVSVSGYGSGGDGYETSDAECDRWCDGVVDVDSLEIDEIEECFSIHQIVDLGGMPVKIVDLPIKMDDFINGSWKNEQPDKKHFEKDELGYGTLTHTYQRVALLIWPEARGLVVKVGDVYDYASDALKTSESRKPTTREVKLVNHLIKWCSRCSKHVKSRGGKAKKLMAALGILRESAERWNDADIFVGALKSCGVDRNIDFLGMEGFISAWQTFGWDALREFCATLIQTDGSNLRRHAVVQRLMALAKEESNEEFVRWCVEQGDAVIQSLKTVNADQIEWLMEIATDGGADYFQTIILPQLFVQPSIYDFWLPFVARLDQERLNIPHASPEIITTIISQCVAHAVATLPTFPTRQVKTYTSLVDQIDVDSIMNLLKLCVKNNKVALCSAVFSKLKEASTKGPRHQKFPPVDYYSALIPMIDQHIRRNPGLDAFSATFTDFFNVAVGILLESLSRSRGLDSIESLKILMLALQRTGGVSMLRERLTTDRIKGLATMYSLKPLALSIVSSLKPLNEDQRAIEDYSTIANDLVRATISSSNLQSLHQKQFSSQYISHVLDLIKFCFQVGTRSQCNYLVECVMSPPSGTVISREFISSFLIPFVEPLKQFLVSQDIDLAAEPWQRIFAAAVEGYASRIVTPKPSEFVPASELQKVGCGCSECTELQSFFFSDRDVIVFPRTKAIRVHLEQRLGLIEKWGVRWETIKYGSPHQLQISKPAAMQAIGLWSAVSVKGQNLLKLLGNKEKQRQILGSAFANVHEMIFGTIPPPTLAGEKRPSTSSRVMSRAPDPKRRKRNVY